ncbi:MAG: 50S ribosomal protein L24 [Candidatus Micrarchaeota archaeon]|nr:50S ribosomal protein L24 [Candidatus Micrarchaeota archaeon]
MGIVKSRQPRKKRKFLYNAPLHLAGKFRNAHLSKELRAKMKKRAVRIRKGDTVKIMKGKFRGISGKVLAVLAAAVNVEGAVVKKIGGKEIPVAIPASNLVITQMVERK